MSESVMEASLIWSGRGPGDWGLVIAREASPSGEDPVLRGTGSIWTGQSRSFRMYVSAPRILRMNVMFEDGPEI